MDKLAEHGIQLRNTKAGDHKTICPQCSHTRRNKKDQCLSVTIEGDGGAEPAQAIINLTAVAVIPASAKGNAETNI